MADSNTVCSLIANGLSPLTTTASPDVSSNTSDTPTPPNGLHEKNWAARYQSIEGLEEQRQLLGTEEESSDRHSSDGDAEDSEDVWSLTKEQHEYYEMQFRTLQPDINGLVNGREARKFFEKSDLSVEELRKIWQLADLTRDGALCLVEFKIAMHLVVSRVHGVRLPTVLPEPLVSIVLASNQKTHASNSGSLSSSPLKGKEWTKFADSPTSTLSSPGPKPVNFDFQRPTVEQNPKIFHPVAVKASPLPDPTEEIRSDLKKIIITDSLIVTDSKPIKPIQRPQGKKYTTPGPGAIPPPPSSEEMSNSGPTSLPVSSVKKEPPPPPPPRPSRTHIRSSSLDLTKLGRNMNAAPSIPPRVSPSTNISSRLGDTQAVTNEPKVNPDPPYQERKLVVPEICLEEKNRYLRAVCQELQEELNGLREERIALEFKLKKLHSRSPVLVHSP